MELPTRQDLSLSPPGGKWKVEMESTLPWKRGAWSGKALWKMEGG